MLQPIVSSRARLKAICSRLFRAALTDTLSVVWAACDEKESEVYWKLVGHCFIDLKRLDDSDVHDMAVALFQTFGLRAPEQLKAFLRVLVRILAEEGVDAERDLPIQFFEVKSRFAVLASYLHEINEHATPTNRRVRRYLLMGHEPEG